MNRVHLPLFVGALVALLGGTKTTAQGVVLLDDDFADGTIADETDLPNETEVFVGTPEDVTEGVNSFRYDMASDSSRKAHFYFAEPGQVARLGVGDTLSASLSFIPRDTINFDDTSRSFRFGVFHDPTDAFVQMNTNDDGGGSGDPWSDAEGYGVQVAMLSDPDNTRSVFDLGKRTDLLNTSLLGSSGAYTKTSGGDPAVYALDTEYTLTMDITKVSATETTVTTTLSDAGGVLSSYTVSDNGTDLGTAASYDRFSFVGIRISNEEETADLLEFTRFRVEGPALIPEPSSAVLAIVAISLLGLFIRRS